MCQTEDSPAKPIIDRLIEETILREGKLPPKGIPRLPSGYELAGKIWGIRPGLGPTFGFEVGMGVINSTTGIEHLGGEKIIYGTSFCRPDSKEIIQTIMVTRKARERLGDGIRAAYFIDPNSHSVMEYVDAIARDYKIPVEDLKKAFSTELAEGRTHPYNGELIQFALPPSYYGLPVVANIQDLDLPKRVKDIWISKLIEMQSEDYKKPRTFGNWIIEISKAETEVLLEDLGYDKSMIKIYSLDDILSFCPEISIRGIAADVQSIAEIYAPTVSAISKLPESSETEPSMESVLRGDHELPMAQESYEMGMICLIGRDGKKILINQNGEPIVFMGNKRINLRLKAPFPEGFEGEPYLTYRYICQSIQNMTYSEAQSKYPIQPSGVGYYTILGMAIGDKATIIADDYEQPRGPFAAMSYTKVQYGMTSIATPKPLLGTEGDFNIPPDLGLLLCLPESERRKLKLLLQKVGDQFASDDVRFFNGANFIYDPKEKVARVDIRRIDRNVTLALRSLRDKILKQFPSERDVPRSSERSETVSATNILHALYMYNPIALESLATNNHQLSHLPHSVRVAVFMLANRQSQNDQDHHLLTLLGFNGEEIDYIQSNIDDLNNLPNLKYRIQKQLAELELDSEISRSEYEAIQDYLTSIGLQIEPLRGENSNNPNSLVKQILEYLEDSQLEEIETQCCLLSSEYQKLCISIKNFKDAIEMKDSSDPNERDAAMNILRKEVSGELFVEGLKGKKANIIANAILHRLEYIQIQYQLVALGLQDRSDLDVLENQNLLRNPSRIAALKRDAQTRLQRAIKQNAKRKYKEIYEADISPLVEQKLRENPSLDQSRVAIALAYREQIKQINSELQQRTRVLESFVREYTKRWIDLTNQVITNGVEF